MIIKNPTKEQFKTLTGIIYLIENKINGKKYYGETEKTFNKRYSSCKWWKYASSKYFRNSIKKYGKDSFKVSIVECGIKTKKELLQLQNKYIIEDNTLFPNGYNFVLDDENGPYHINDETRLKSAITKSHGKIYIIKEIDTGQIKSFKCRKQIIDKYNISSCSLENLLKNRIRTLKGICLPDTNPDKWEYNDILKIVIDQNNNKYEFYNCAKFSREYNCSYNGITNVVSKKKKSTKSKDGKIFRLPSTSVNSFDYKRSIRKINGSQKYREIILTRIIDNKDFSIHMEDDINLFCKKNNIIKSDIYSLTSSNQKSAKGFKLKRLIYL